MPTPIDTDTPPAYDSLCLSLSQYESKSNVSDVEQDVSEIEMVNGLGNLEILREHLSHFIVTPEKKKRQSMDDSGTPRGIAGFKFSPPLSHRESVTSDGAPDIEKITEQGVGEENSGGDAKDDAIDDDAEQVLFYHMHTYVYICVWIY